MTSYHLFAATSLLLVSIHASEKLPDSLCTLECQNGGVCEFVADTYQKLTPMAKRGSLVHKCNCGFNFTGLTCQIPVHECLSEDCECKRASVVGAFAGSMACLKDPVTEYCDGQYLPPKKIDYCTHGGKCLNNILMKDMFAKHNDSSNIWEDGCVCPKDFYGSHCENIKYNTDDEVIDASDNAQGTPVSTMPASTSTTDQSSPWNSETFIYIAATIAGLLFVLVSFLLFRKWRHRKDGKRLNCCRRSQPMPPTRGRSMERFSDLQLPQDPSTERSFLQSTLADDMLHVNDGYNGKFLAHDHRFPEHIYPAEDIEQLTEYDYSDEELFIGTFEDLQRLRPSSSSNQGRPTRLEGPLFRSLSPQICTHAEPPSVDRESLLILGLMTEGLPASPSDCDPVMECAAMSTPIPCQSWDLDDGASSVMTGFSDVHPPSNSLHVTQLMFEEDECRHPVMYASPLSFEEVWDAADDCDTPSRFLPDVI